MHAARLGRSARLQRVHAVLADGREHSTLDLVRRAQVCAVNSCIAELRANGAVIECRKSGMAERSVFFYRMTRPAPCPR